VVRGYRGRCQGGECERDATVALSVFAKGGKSWLGFVSGGHGGWWSLITSDDNGTVTFLAPRSKD